MNLPTWLTVIRLIFVPLVVIFFYLPLQYAGLYASIFFILAAITDAFDGYLARKYNQTTRFGAFLDPVADKIIVVVSLTLIIEDNHSLLLTIPALIIISREILVSALREWIASVKKDGHSIPVSIAGKVKTILQMVSIIGLLIFSPSNYGDFWGYGKMLHDIALHGLYIATILTLWSMMGYIKAASKTLESEL